MIGLVDRARIDEELYDDFETVKAREVCRLLIMLLSVSYVYIGSQIIVVRFFDSSYSIVVVSFLFVEKACQGSSHSGNSSKASFPWKEAKRVNGC